MTRSNTGTRQIGFQDTVGDVFFIGIRVIRGVYPSYESYYRRILKYCAEKNVFRMGIINTWEIEEPLFPDGRYGLLLEHERVPFISYPHEWPVSMFKDSALFHIRLNMGFSTCDLMIADIHPYNVLFMGTHPVFVDFTSLIFSDDLMAQIQEMNFPGKKMCIRPSLYLLNLYIGDFFSYFLGPLYCMAWQHHTIYRSLGADTRHVFPYPGIRVRELLRYKPAFCLMAVFSLVEVAIALLDRDRHKKKFWRTLYRQVARIKTQLPAPDIFGARSDRSEVLIGNSLIQDVMNRITAGSLLDLGNQGSFAIAAAEAGCSVVAIDSDEATMERLYLKADHDNLAILPLLIDMGSLLSLPGDVNFPGRGWEWGYLPIADRLQCDTVVVGPSFWSKISGQDKNLRSVVSFLDKVALQTLLLVIPVIDEGSPLSSSLIKKSLDSYFSVIEIYDTSDPRFRLLRCERAISDADSQRG